jgi:hypothetical protein
MIQDFYDNYVFLYIMGGLCVFGVFLKCFLLVVYNKLIKASESMTSTKKNWLKNMRLRFESSYQLQLGVNDVDTYVDKYVSKIKCGGLLLSTWENLSGQTIGLCLLTGSFAGILGFVYECGQGPVLFTFFAGAWTAIIVNIVDNIVNISAHKQMLRYNLIDYFENNLKVRMEQEIYHPEARRKYQRQYFTETIENNQEVSGDTSNEINVAASKESMLSMGKEPSIILSKESDIASSPEHKNAKLSKKEEKQAKQQAKLDVKAAKKAKKQEAKQAKLDAIQAKKQAKHDKKQQVIEEKQAKKKAREDIKIAREKATIEALLAKKNAKEAEIAAEKEAKENQRKLAQKEKERIENERKQKELENNKAYREKMRLKEEKEREAAKRREEQLMLEKSKENNQKKLDDKLEEKVITIKKQELKLEKSGKQEKQEIENQFDDMEEDEVIALTATSKEEELLIEEVLKDFLF